MNCFKSIIVFILIGTVLASCQSTEEAFFTSGFRSMEVKDSSVVIWTRLYAQETPNAITHTRKSKVFRHPIDFNEDMPVSQMDGGVQGKQGKVKITLIGEDEKYSSPWLLALEENDFTVSHLFDNLKPGTEYKVILESKKGPKKEGAFSTALSPQDIAPITFTTSTCQYFWSYDDSIRGFKTYDKMSEMDPDFFVQTGDYVYYDKPGPLAKTLESARHKWHAMDSKLSLVDFHLKVPMYMIKDDHDLLKDDVSDQAETYGTISWEDGLKLWKENVPLKGAPYRTFRWGKDLQIWLLEGREFRSVNNMEDGPDKTILGSVQKLWLERTLKESDATFKILFSATPIVGPDRDGKTDNHANKSFQTEGDWMRHMLSKIENLYIINGDRHWQYHSVDSVAQVNEFGSGPVSDYHVQGWKQEDLRSEHRFLRVSGGFMGVKISRQSGQPQVEFTHYDVNGNEVYSSKFQAKIK
ncbi:alkaline phosphatase [Flavivirga sp. 57AJ16]|uniref:alkaline phosphatase D family protein n=1 Tax=Flavivirga sp. 57AJ16 TaxID=3025307 RepID=UPI002365F5CB|nr:alkaline phosphatase D family protein [Flavivirga sp. 57AJ16]MDD7885441.1 alkaline phosphatase D family protein [Flavivirga sp. 57AJ16]